MKQDKIYKEVDTLAKSEKLMEKRYGVESFIDGEPYFTTSQETDIWELIRDGLTADEIISEMKQW
jgi:DNA-binding NarL/FixJ family response regulator|tara:strand:+ start:256 stop:450 length:195 start_codon:yes stop_codon:yes gene_type:complete